MPIDANEALSCVLSYSLKDESRAVSHALLVRFGGLYGVLSADSAALLDTDGMNERSTRLIRLLSAIMSRRGTERLKFGRSVTDDECDEYFKSLFIGSSVEKTYMMSIDEKGRPIATDFVSDGTVNSTEILPRKIIDMALKRKAHTVILAHNHPGGLAKPSVEDIRVTESLADVLDMSGIKLLRHIVVAGCDSYSILPDE